MIGYWGGSVVKNLPVNAGGIQNYSLDFSVIKATGFGSIYKQF